MGAVCSGCVRPRGFEVGNEMIRELVLSMGLGEPSNRIWSTIYPYTPLRKKRDKALRRLLSGLIHTGDLVFDVGANKGFYTDLFLSMGARTVVAVEPNMRLSKQLVRDGVYSVNVALGSYNHYTDYYICEIDGLSSLSTQYTKLKRYSNLFWEIPIKVYVTTIDNLARVYGVPDFIKIDVEGYEAEVIAGMTFAPKALSFEFIPESIEILERCITRLNLLGNYEYTYTIGLEPHMKFKIPWCSANNLINHIYAVFCIIVVIMSIFFGIILLIV